MAHVQLLTILVTGEPYQAVDIEGLKKPNMDYPMVVPVRNLDKDEDGLLILNAIIESSFRKVEGGIVGKMFQLQGGEMREDKDYRDIRVYEMEAE